MSDAHCNKTCDTCDHFAEYTMEYAAKTGYDGCCLFGTRRCDDRPRSKHDTCDLWKKMHDAPCCDNCYHVVEMSDGSDLICGVGLPTYVKENGVPTAEYKCSGQCRVWASKRTRTNDPLLRYIRRF